MFGREKQFSLPIKCEKKIAFVAEQRVKYEDGRCAAQGWIETRQSAL
jgi:hypothetical protein